VERVLEDGVVRVRPFAASDSAALVDGRDALFDRFLGPGSPEPAPLACICVADEIVGWIDYDDERHWLGDDEVNVVYNVFPAHRRRGYATRALLLLCRLLEAEVPPRRATLLIDPTNEGSLAVAARAGFVRAETVDEQILFRSPPRHDPQRPAGPVT
jgi:RimJ/RimL family protein N-acetyltransferase